MIIWNQNTDQIDVVPWPDRARHSSGYRMSVGACDMSLHKLNRHQQCAMLFVHFNTIVVRDGVPVDAAHRAFLKIDEYRSLISPDIREAEDSDSPLDCTLAAKRNAKRMMRDLAEHLDQKDC